MFVNKTARRAARSLAALTLAEPMSREDELREQIMRKYTTGLR